MSFVLLFLSCNKTVKKQEAQSPLNKVLFADDALLDTLQKQTFNYFWEGAEPNSGLARERIHIDGDYPNSPKNTVTTGGSGFGFMALLVGIKNDYISREDGLNRFIKMVDFLEKSDRLHGA